MKYVCIHGHFYQPPRENPWLEEVEVQDSAYPFHDWNERINAECYAPNTASRILEPEGRIIEIVNNYSKISFNFGPTLLSWLERHELEVYNAILEADKLSMQRFSGHGSAIAQVYNHMIMPLANKRDKYTQVSWGIKDFQRRFGRLPEGMWLPETAVDIETLDILAELGIKFTILALHQAKKVRKTGGDWEDVSAGKIDTTRAYLCRLPSGRTINLFFYNAQISHEVAFENLLGNGEVFAKRLTGSSAEIKEPQLEHIATDGETYGHHHKQGEMSLSYCLYCIEANNLAKITVYGEYLEKHPPDYEVEIIENTSWSCVHGIERWRSNCGCSTGHADWNQEWRVPLRQAMDILRDKLILFYEQEASKYLRNPWEARNEYIYVILDRILCSRDYCINNSVQASDISQSIEKFLGKHAVREISKEEKVKVLKLLEMQRNAMLMYASCGWFFDEISGLESVKVMEYASAAMYYFEELAGMSIEPEYLKILEKAPSNVFANSATNGAAIYEQFVRPAKLDLLRVGAHYAISSIFEEYPGNIKTYCYSAKSEIYRKIESGRMKLAIGKANIASDITLDEKTISFAVLHLGDINMNGGVRYFIGEQAFSEMQEEIRSAFEKSDIPSTIRLMDKHFGTHNYSLWHLFKDEQRKIIEPILRTTLEGIESSYRQIFENNYTTMNFLHEIRMPLPRTLLLAAEFILNTDLRRILEGENDLNRAGKIISEARKLGVKLDSSTLGYIATNRLNSLMEMLNQHPEDMQIVEKIINTIKLLRTIPVELDLWKAQNIYCSIGRKYYRGMKEKAGDEHAEKWMEFFKELSTYLRVKIS